jgi:uncharacterized protein
MVFLRRYWRYGLIAVLIIAVVAVALATSGNAPKKADTTASNTHNSACGPYRDDHTVLISGQTFKAEIPKNPAAYDKGLGGRPCILSSQAMLFVFKKPGQYAFWMKGMNFPIDIIWIGADHRVAAVEGNEQPSTYPDKFVNQKPAQYVLEVKANTANELHINIGTAVSL